MKAFFGFLFLLIFNLTASATDYYISPSGSDGNSGSSGSPWRTLAYAASQSSSGDLIHVTAGTYVESSRVNLPAGVSIIGAGNSSIIQSNYSVGSDLDDAILRLYSSSLNTTGQSISYLMIDGQNWTSLRAIATTDRNNVEISNCTIQNFNNAAITVNSSSGDGAFVSGLSIHDCVINDDCSVAPGGQDGDGSITMYGVDGVNIYNNSFTQTARSAGSNGDIIRGICEYGFGWKNVKIYNNTFTKPNSNGTDYNFTIEAWVLSDNCEFYNNTFNGTGGIDPCGIEKGNGTYGLSIHDNTFQASANFAQVSNSPSQQGINFETQGGGSPVSSQQYIYIYNNYFKYMPNPIRFDFTIAGGGSAAYMDHIYIYDNVFDQFGYTNNVGVSMGVYMNDHSQSPITYDNIHIYNNTFVGNSYSQQGVYWNTYGSAHTNFSIDNNIFYGLKSYPVYFNSLGNSASVTTISVQNNDYYNNGNNSPSYGGVTMYNKTEQNSITTNPLFVSSSDYHLQSGSPAIDAGINVGLPFSGNAPDIGRYEYSGSSSALVVNAGPDQTITLPVDSVTLSGSATDTNGTDSIFFWKKISGPSSGNITNSDSSSTSVINLVQGVYQFQLQVTDNNGTSGSDIMVVTVNAAVNNKPVANAGADQSITLPVNNVTLSGSAIDAVGTVTNFFWTEISGPSSAIVANATSATSSVTGLLQGVYQFQLKVVDNNGAVGLDTMQVTVNAAPNIPPVANAGADQTITLPVNTVTLSGSGTDADGTVVSYLWTKISGPSSFNIVNASSPLTSVTGLVQGVYQFQLKVTDNSGAIGTDIMQVRVNASSNVPPIVNAGSSQNITLPTNSVALSGSASDADGTVVSYLWSKLSGPGSFNFSVAGSATTNVTGLVQGVYQFQLLATDNNGSTGTAVVQVVVNAGTNIPPVANAGPDQTITLPLNSATLSGSGSDADGTVVSYKWTKLSGPSSGTITSANSAITTVSGLVQGVYQFQLKVTDNNGAVNTNAMQVTVDAASNLPPIANAGSDQSITLPLNSIQLSGSGSDADGTVVSYLWTKISGPSSGTITNIHSAATSVNGLVQGVYQFQLQATDNNGASGTDVMQVTVNPAANIPPVANAGLDQSITLPVNSVTLSGSGSDADGTIVSYLWTELSGPAGGSITNANSAITSVGGLVQGVYQFQLQVTDNNGNTSTDITQLTVNAAANISPVANAGADQTITLPVNIVTLSGSGSDADGTVVNYLWTKISGPSSFNFVNASSPVTQVSGLVQGIYLFQLQVTDNDGATGTNIMQVTVNPAPNIPPVANAGVDQSIILPTDSVTLSGTGSDADGIVVSYSWTKISGPSSFNILNSTYPATIVTGLTKGVYRFRLKVTDNSGATGTSVVQVTVNAAANVPPVADAGGNQVITLPVDSINLSGSGTDSDGTVVSYLWTEISGPSSFNISNASSPGTSVTGLVQGVYQFELQVTDNDGAIGTSIMQVTVNAVPNIPPVANAGADQTITLPVNNVTLSGSGSDVDGTVVSYLWTKISGPSSGTIINTNSATTSVTALVQGVYQFQLQATDNSGATGADIVQVIVNAAVNIPPVANAGVNQVITLPVNSVTLSGSGSDADGTLVGYLWTKISGPSSYNFVNPSSPVTDITGLVQGVYQFQFQVTDNDGAIATSIMQVTVNAAVNVPPVASAGPDQTITLPNSGVTLSGSGSDADGTIVSYLWTKISGPSAGIIGNVNTASTVASGLVQGVYQFQLEVKDNNGATANNVTQVTVNSSVNIPVSANAGPDQTITLPTNSVTLSGSGEVKGAVITGYSWKQISGPSIGDIVSPGSAVTQLNNLVSGNYQFEFTVTDNLGGNSSDTVAIIVAAPRLNLDIQSNSMNVYPNPVTDNATLEINSTQPNPHILVTITSMNGQIVYKNDITSGQINISQTLNLSNLMKGAYAVTVYFSSVEKQTLKILKL